jgi:aminocarboxymuconate-semialdehyde decarboxylase
LRCGLDFFGADRVVFASDCPFDPEGGPMFIREGIRSVEDLKLPAADKRKIYFGNALKLLKMPEPKEAPKRAGKKRKKK